MRVVMAFAFLLSGCAEDAIDDVVEDVPGPARPVEQATLTRTCPGQLLVLGTGNETFIPVEDGDDVPLWRGPSGGYWFHLAVRVRGMDPQDVRVHYALTFAESGETFADDSWRLRLSGDLGGGWYERLGIFAMLPDDLPPDEVRDHDVLLEATVTDNLSGCTLAGSMLFHAVRLPPP